jgi:tetratricopeptide (TPR) repeat protein
LEFGKKIRAYDAIAIADSFPSAVSTLNEFESAMKANSLGLDLALEHDHFSEASMCYFHRAVAHVNTKGASKQALDLFNEALDYSTKTGQFMTTLFNKAALAYEIYLPLGEWQKAAEIAEEAKRSVLTLPPSSLFVIISESITGQVLLFNGDLDQAEEYLRGVELKTRDFGILQIDVPLYMGLAKLYFAKGQYEKAKNYLTEAYRRSKKRGLVIINCVPHVQLLSLMIEFALITKFEKEDMNNLLLARSADSLFSELTESCTHINEKWAFGYLHRSQGLIKYHKKEFQNSEKSLGKSIEIWRDLGWRYDLARSLYSFGGPVVLNKNILKQLKTSMNH